MELIQALFYPVFVLAVTVAIMIFIPRDQLRGLLPAAAVIGGLGDVIVVWLFQDVLKIIWFKNHGIWECANQHFFSPIGWTMVRCFTSTSSPVTLESCATFTLRPGRPSRWVTAYSCATLSSTTSARGFSLFPSTSHS